MSSSGCLYTFAKYRAPCRLRVQLVRKSTTSFG